MRTTLDIDDDLLAYAKETAALTRSTAGKVLSNLARRALQPETTLRPETQEPVAVWNGFVQLRSHPGDGKVTPEMVQQLLDETE
jgi:hypothetical protein